MTLALNDVLALGASEVMSIDMSTVVLVVIAITCAVVGRLWVAGQVWRTNSEPN